MQDTFIFLDQNGEQRGPYSISDIAHLLHQGIITPYTIISDGVDSGEELFRYYKTCHLPQPVQQRPPTTSPISPQTPVRVVHVTLPNTVTVQPTSRIIYILCGLFLGAFGVHNFIAGFTGRGISQLCTTVFLGWLGFPLLILGIWILCEICTQKQDAHGIPFN